MVVAAYPYNPQQTSHDPWEVEFQPNNGYKLQLSQGVYKVYKTEADLAANKPIPYEVTPLLVVMALPLHLTGYGYGQVVDLETFVSDMQMLCGMIADGPLKSFCFQRLEFLQNKYKLHNLLNEIRVCCTAQPRRSLDCLTTLV